MPSMRGISAALVLLAAVSLHAETVPAEQVDYFELLMSSSPRGYLAAIGAPDRKPELENPREAFEWRLRTMQDKHGRIPPGAFHRANVHRRNNIKNGRSTGRPTSQAATLSPFSWISRGPRNVGGRTLALLAHPNNNQVLFAGTASGGIWKSANAGQTWLPINDFMANLNIGALAFDPLNPNTMYAGTGERFYDRVVRNAGIFKSTNGGLTWAQLPATANWLDVQAIAPQPGSSSTLLAATGNGIFRTSDGGVTWSMASAPGLENAQGVVFDPWNGSRAVAAVRRNDNTVRPYLSTDGGLTFNAATAPILGGADIAVAFAPSQPATVYALVGPNIHQLWRSTDNGATFTLQSGGNIGCDDRRCTVWVSPTDPNLVVTGGTHLFRSANGGVNFTQISDGFILTPDPHPDIHCAVQDPLYNGTTNRMVYFCTDGGVWRSSDIAAAQIGSTWTPLTATYQTTQFYSGVGHDVGTGTYLGGTQDNGTLRTTNFSNNAILVFDGDGGYVEIDPTSLNTWFLEWQNLHLRRTLDGGATTEPIDAGITGSRNFVAPFILDPNDSNRLYAGTTSLWRTNNATAPTVTWTAVRPTGSDTVSAIAVAPGNSNIVYLGQSDGVMQKTTNGLATNPTWTNVDNNSSVNPLPDRYITRILIDPNNSNIVYVALGEFEFDNLWKSTNGGVTFVSASGSGVTSLPPAPVRGIARHPQDPLRLYAGTDVGIYESENGGQTWLASEAGPADVTIDELRFVIGTQTLLAATHGRGLWTADVSGIGEVPSGLISTASGTSMVVLSWTGVSNATSYRILRSVDNAPFSELTTVSTTSHSDFDVVAGKTYLYKVQAWVNSTLTGESNLDLATTIVFTFDNQLLGKVFAAIHLQEIRNAVNAVRVSAGLDPLTFSNPAVFGSLPVANDITQLRTGLISAYNQLGLTPPTFTGTISGGGSTLLQQSHWQEIRDATK
jgi:hypothetical protein